MSDAAQQASSEEADAAGFTLAEMLIAMVLLGIIFAGAAGALINLSRASISSERRVQATALVTQVHEQFQSMSWDAAVLYPEELADLAGIDGYLDDGGEPTFQGHPIAVYEGDCDPADDCRWDETPEPFTLETVDGRTYRVYRIITEIDRAGTATSEIKRLTTIVSFEVMGRWVTQQLDSERAGTSGELGLPDPPGPAFNIVPSTVPIDEDGFHQASIRFDAVFPPEMSPSVTNVTATLQTLDGPVTLDTFQPVLLAEMIRRIDLGVGADPGGAPLRFAPGTQTVEWTYEHEAQPQNAATQLTFEFDDEATEDEDNGSGDFDGLIQNVSGPTQPVRVRRQGGGQSSNYYLCDPLSIEATAVNLDLSAGDQVRAEFNPDSGPATSIELLHTSGSNFRMSFEVGARSDWWPSTGATISHAFVITARDGQSTPTQFSAPRELTVNFLGVGSC